MAKIALPQKKMGQLPAKDRHQQGSSQQQSSQGDDDDDAIEHRRPERASSAGESIPNSDHENSSQSEPDSAADDSERETETDSENEEEESEATEMGSSEERSEESGADDEESASSEEAYNTGSSVPETSSVPCDSSRKICLICLKGEKVVTCAGCGVPVHRKCYGSNLLPQNASQWFCDVCCKAVRNCYDGGPPFCVLCPIRGGAMRVTEVGNYFHVVCAMVHKKMLDENDALCERPNLLELANQFGQNSCMLCKDSEYAYCGVSVPCDSGMCKKFVHVSCAQRSGFFAHDGDLNAFYVWCYDHRDLEASMHNKKLYKNIMQQMDSVSHSGSGVQAPEELQRGISKDVTVAKKNNVQIPATAFAEFIYLDNLKKEKRVHNDVQTIYSSTKKSQARRSAELHIDGILFEKSIPMGFSEEFFYYCRTRMEALKRINKFNEVMETKCGGMQQMVNHALAKVHPAVRELIEIYALTGKDICSGSVFRPDEAKADKCRRPASLLPPLSSEESSSRRKKSQSVQSSSKSGKVSQNVLVGNSTPVAKTEKALRRSPRFAVRSQALPERPNNASCEVAGCEDLPSDSRLPKLPSPGESTRLKHSVGTGDQSSASVLSGPGELEKSRFARTAATDSEASTSKGSGCPPGVISAEPDVRVGTPSLRSIRRSKRLAIASTGILRKKGTDSSNSQVSCVHESCKRTNELSSEFIADQPETETAESVVERDLQWHSNNGSNFNDALSDLKHIALNLKATIFAAMEQPTVNSGDAERPCDDDTPATVPASTATAQQSSYPKTVVSPEDSEAVSPLPTDFGSSLSEERCCTTVEQQEINRNNLWTAAEQDSSTALTCDPEYSVSSPPEKPNKEQIVGEKMISSENNYVDVCTVEQKPTEPERPAASTSQQVWYSKSSRDDIVYFVPYKMGKVDFSTSKSEVPFEFEDVPTIGMEVCVGDSESCGSITPPRPPSADVALLEEDSYHERRRRPPKRKKKNLIHVIRVEDID